MKQTPVFLLVFCLLQSCVNHGQLSFVTELPKKLNENSGIAVYKDSTAWFIEDSGNSNSIYKVNFKGKIKGEFEVKNAKNRDWEDLTTDGKGNLYIGDFGNNENKRKDLVIYKTPNPEIEKGDKIPSEKIKFRYPQQKKFPPKKENHFYDTEAFFHWGNALYLFTKNRSNPFTGETFIYKIPDAEGKYDATFVGTLQICEDWKTCQITSADISPDGKRIVLLTYGKLFIMTDFSIDALDKGSLTEIDLGVRSQLESVSFINDNTLLLSDEEQTHSGRNLYTYSLK